MTSPSLPPHIVAALSTPSQRSWETIADWVDGGDHADSTLLQIKQGLATWPKEIPRPPLKQWLRKFPWTSNLLSLALNVAETQTYPLYIAALAQEPRLRLRDGSPAVSLHRQQRGVVETATGRKVAMNGDVPGMADLGGTLTVEWLRRCCWAGNDTSLLKCLDCNRLLTTYRLQLYIELEIKLDGKIPPQAREYTGTSRRQLTDTERQQVQRQQAQLARGGCYIFADRVVDAVEAVVRYRDDVLARIGA